MPTTRRTAVSVFGLLSLAVGAFAGVLFLWRPDVPWVTPLTIGGLAVLLALLGFLRAGTGKLLPAVGMVAGLAVIAFWLYSTGWLQRHFPQSTATQPQPAPTVQTPGPTDPGGAARAGPSVDDDDDDRPESIFDFGRDGDAGENDVITPRPPRPDPRAGPGPAVAPSPPPTADPGASVELARANLRAARKKLQSAEEALKKGLSGDADYRSAQSAADKAQAELARLRAASGPRSAELVRASQQSMTAKTKLRKVLLAAAQKDATVMAARREVEDAEAALKAARGSGR